MSTETRIRELLRSGKLREYIPAYPEPGFIHTRRVLMSEEAFQQCPPRGPSVLRGLTGKALANTRATLEHIVGGGYVPVGIDGVLKDLRTEHTEIWEIRVLDQPQTRLFCWFIDFNILVITHCVLRSSLERSSGPKWDRQINKLVQKRENLFPDPPVFKASSRTEYLSNSGE